MAAKAGKTGKATGRPGRDAIYQLKVTLKGSKPPIWRRLQVPGNLTLDDLHRVLQIAMGWDNAHLHQFTVGRTYYSDPLFELDDALGDVNDSTRTTLRQVAPAEKAKFTYEYDFGDSWEHEILVERIVPPEPGARYPVCLTGRRACPPEDCGGIWGYAALLETIQNPDDPEREEMLDWLGGAFDPEAFDLEAVNQALQRLQPERAG